MWCVSDQKWLPKERRKDWDFYHTILIIPETCRPDPRIHNIGEIAGISATHLVSTARTAKAAAAVAG